MLHVQKGRIAKEEAEEMRALAVRLRRANPVRQYAEALLADPKNPPADTLPLMRALRRMSASRWRERAVAAWATAWAPLAPNDKRVACGLLAAQAAPRSWTSGGATLVAVPWRAAVAGPAFVAAVLCAASALPTTRASVLAAVALIFAGAIFVLRLEPEAHAQRAALEAVRALGRLGLPDAIPRLVPLIVRRRTGTRNEPTEIESAAREALRQALGCLAEGDYGRVDAAIVRAVCRTLECPDRKVVLAALRALGFAGGGSAVQPVQRLAKRTKSGEVQVAVERVLPILRERERSEKAPERLLRAADAPQGGEGLLRPVQGVPDTEPELLLRPVEGEDTA